jgi:predicted Zn-dependent protease
MPKALLLKATIYGKSGKSNEAIALVDGLVQRFPGQPGLLLEKARMLDLVGRSADADPIFAQLQAQFPQDASLQQAIAARPARSAK